MSNSAITPYKWRFFTAGGFDQVKLETGADLMHLDELDQKLWVALACPTTGLEFDPKTAALIDLDKDGRIRASELITAVKWVGGMLKNPDILVKCQSSLALSEISDSTAEGLQLLASATQIITDLGKASAGTISLEDVLDANKIFANTVFNGDGVIIAESASDDATRKVIGEIAGIFGTVMDRSGKPGIDQSKADAFFTQAAAYEAWVKASEINADKIMVAGEATAAANTAVMAIKAKVDDFFGRCRLAAFDARTVPIMNRSELEYAALAGKDLSIHAGEFAHFPLAQISAGKALPLKSGLNPAHAAAVTALLEVAIKPLLGDKDELTEADWAALQGKLAAYNGWLLSKAGVQVEGLGIIRIREILASTAQGSITTLIAKDKALEQQVANISNVEKLLRYVRDIYLLCINFVNFKELYSGTEPSIFQCGTLFLDQRSCTLCLTVEDAARHASMAGLAGAYLAYVDCIRKGTGEKLSIVAIFSQGDDDNLMVGRNGIFYDRKGRDYDATITKILSNPISIRQAFWSPYKKLVRLIEEQIAKRAAAADSAANDRLAKTTEAVSTATSAQVQQKGIDIGMIAALSVAFGSIGTALAYFLGLFKGVPPWQLPLMVIGMALLVSGPSMILAYMKLRRRNLGPILDANGWAVNAKAKINVPFGTSLTEIATLPPGAHIDITDKYAEKSSIWPKVALVLFVVWWAWSYWTWVPPKSDDSKNGNDSRTNTAPAVAATNAPAATPAK